MTEKLPKAALQNIVDAIEHIHGKLAHDDLPALEMVCAIELTRHN